MVGSTEAGIHIIPYQEQLGNYNASMIVSAFRIIIPYQEQLGNYNELYDTEFVYQIIPYQEQLGNYNLNNFVVAGNSEQIEEGAESVGKKAANSKNKKVRRT